MASYKEIVTKAVVGKGKKTFATTHTVSPEVVPTTILGCWVKKIKTLLTLRDTLM